MKISRIVALLLVFVFVQAASAQTDQKRVERLAGLAKVWGTVKYFHPFLAYREIDWDKALVETIPKVNAAKSSQEYQSALNSMLNALGDKATFAVIESNSKNNSEAKTDSTDAVRLADGVLVLDIMKIAQTLTADWSAGQKINQQIKSLLPNARGVVLDCRADPQAASSDDEEVAYSFDEFLRNTVPQFLEKDVPLGTVRYRMHSGYAPQDGTTSGGYYSSLVTDTPQLLAGKGAKKMWLSFIVNDGTPDISTVLGGLQAAGVAFVVQEGDLTKEFGANAYRMKLSDGISFKMRTTELVNPEGTIGFKTDSTAQKTNDDAVLKEAVASLGKSRVSSSQNTASVSAALRGTKDNHYAEMKFPASEYRLLALFRFWSVIDNFYPYKNLIGDGWRDVLERYIPKFEANKTAIEYQATVLEMVTEMHDSHGFVRGTDDFNETLGGFTVPFLVRYLDGKAVVFKVLDDKLSVKVGDTIVAIDGGTEQKRREYLSRFFAASTPQRLLYRVSLFLLSGPKDSKAKITLLGVDGKTREIEAPRTQSLNERKFYEGFLRTNPVVEVLPSGFGYVDLARLQVGEVDAMFEKIKDTKAVIFDMRGYPNGTAWAIAPRLTDKTAVGAALFSRPLLTANSLGSSDVLGGAEFLFTQPIPERKGDVYRGKVVMLIDEWAISQSEHTCLFFESATNVTFIGMPTAGANGDVTNLVLPGEIFVNFSGHAVRHADGRQLQRLGIQPTIKVSPTVKGIAEGRDEILEAAVKFLQTPKK
jgi:hypothetical protein